VNDPAPRPGSYSPVPDLAELCAVQVRRLMSNADMALRTRAILLRLRDGLDIGLEDSKHALAWREALDRSGMRRMTSDEQQGVYLDEITRVMRENNDLRAENERLRAELDAHGADVSVNIIPGDRAMLERVLAATSDWKPEEGDVVRAAADGTQATWRGGMWVLE
jgi:hypothetical protein